MKACIRGWNVQTFCAAAAAWLLAGSVGLAQGDDRLVGVWVGQGWVNTVELLLRSDGRYEAKSTTTGSEFGPRIDRGRYEIVGDSLRMISYDFFQQPAVDSYEFQLDGDSLSLSGGPDVSVFNLSMEYQFNPGSRAEVLAKEQASHDLVRRWTRHLLFQGDEEWTFRPGGYYVRKNISENVPGFIEYQRGRSEQSGTQLTLKPYGGSVSTYEVDIFGTTLTLIYTNNGSGQFAGYEEVPGSAAEVAAKAAEAQAFLSSPDWQAGVWQIKKGDNAIDLLLRPDGVYSATNATARVHRVLRGRYTLLGAEIDLVPFVGQDRWVLDEADFGMEAQAYTLDYYDGELQLIDHKPGILQSVTLAHPSAGTHAAVMEIVRQAQLERAREGWPVGIWEANAPATAWMEFTFRPDNRYIAKAGAGGVAGEVERGQYVVAPGKITLAPYAGNGPARGFELDLYDGDLFLIGDSKRLVMVRKIVGSETGVIDKVRNPVALNGERGSILGLWTANRPKEHVELVFRQDGEFRLKRCTNGTISYDYGLYTVDMTRRSLVYDSRLAPIQSQRLDYYGGTLTIHGGTNTTPSTYTVNLGSVDAAIAASHAADEAEAQVDAQWLARVPIGPADPNGMPMPDFTVDPNPGQIFEGPTVFSQYRFYRRLIPLLLAAIEGGQMVTVAVNDTREWHFLASGRVLVRFRIWSSDGNDVRQEVLDAWGAYGIEPKPTETDVLHRYADNGMTVRLDAGDRLRLTLENGRRNLFLEKEQLALDLWAAEYQPIVCQRPANADASLMNTGLSLSTAIVPDPTGTLEPFPIAIVAPTAGTLSVSGNAGMSCCLVLECAPSLASPVTWQPLCTNSVPAGPFSFTIPERTGTAAFFRLRSQ